LIVVAIAVALVASLAIVFLQVFYGEAPPEEEETVEEFEEFHELFIYIDANGDASCYLVIQMPPSKFADLLKSLMPLIGFDKAEQTYIESLRSGLSRSGLEMRDPSCEVGIGENFTVIMEWEIPALARWEDNRWTITLEWVDNQSAAKETIAEEDDAWVTIRNIAQMYDIQNVQYRVSFKTFLIPPGNAENVYCPLLGSSQTINYGGGSYSMGSLYSGDIDGRFAIVENGLTLFVAENEITLTPEQLIENSLFYSISYSGVSPENVSFESSVEQVRLDLKYGRKLREQYLIYSGGSWYSLSPAQVLYYAADAIDNYDQGNQFLIQEPIYVAAPDDENGDWGAPWGNFSKDGYVSLAQTIRDEIKVTGKAPGTIQTSLGNIRFRDVLFTFTRILSSYEGAGELSDTLTFVPVPTGELTRGDNKIPAEHAYLLLPDTYVITDTSGVGEVLDNVYEPGYGDRRFAEELSNWTNTNLTYGLSFSPPTSEEVLESGEGQCRDYANVYLALTRTAGIPARRVHGWIVTEWKPEPGLWEVAIGTTPEGKPIGSHAWTQVFIDGEWMSVDPTWGWFESPAYEIYKQQEQTWMSALAGYETARGLV
jgi:transglutaminase-like putative cysteine protease